jgi:glycerol-3-phosphate acyltransferase PlsY
MLDTILWVIVGFVSGSLPFSVWLGRAFARANVRQFGDGNPGAANAWKAGGWRVGLAALLLDYFKGALPVAAAHFMVNLSGWSLALVALAPILGHAFSPFLNFRGGKGLTVTFGVWSGLTLAQAPLVLGLFMVLFYFTLSVEAWAVVLSMTGLLAYLLFQLMDIPLLAVWLGNLIVIVWKHRRELRKAPRLKPVFSVKRHV